MRNKQATKIFSVFSLILLLFTTLFSNFSQVQAVEVGQKVEIVNLGECDRNVKYRQDNGVYSYIITHYVGYYENGVFHPAYCLEVSKPGVDATLSYDVTVQEAIQNEAVWRVLKHGYPYAGTLGLDNEMDAFFATKQAIYRILDGRDANTFYNGGDSRGQAIKNAIVRLVDIGRNGTQTPVNTDVTTNKVGGFVEDGYYYSQEYSISSPVETSEYTITATNGLPNGALITNMSNNVQSTFSGSEHFKVRIPKSSLSNDINIVIALQAKCRVYPVFYRKDNCSRNARLFIDI